MKIKAMLASAGLMLGSIALAAPASAATGHAASTHAAAAAVERCSIGGAIEDIRHGQLRMALEDLGFRTEALRDLRQGHVREAARDILGAHCT